MTRSEPGVISQTSDEALMLRYRDGDVRGFEVLLARHRQAIYNFILRFVGQAAQAEDLLQETFIRVIGSRAHYEPQAKFTTWLYTIARNLCIDAARRGQLRRAASLDAPLAGDGESNDRCLLDVLPDPGAAVDQRLIDRQVGWRIEQSIQTLGEEQREVFIMRELLDLPFAEIASIVGCSENTVKSRMRYALNKLREKLNDYRELAQAAQ